MGEDIRLLPRVGEAIRFLMRGENRGVEASGVGALSGCILFFFVIAFRRREESSRLRLGVLEI